MWRMKSMQRGGSVIVPAILALVVGACCPDAAYEATAENPTVRLPRDEAPHCYGAEWWYYTGRLETESGDGYGVEAVIFHLPGLGLGGVTDKWAAHFAVIDEASGEFVYDQIREVGDLSSGWPPRNGFNLNTQLIQMIGSNGHDEIHAVMQDGPYGLDLALEDEYGPVLHGGTGYVPFGQDGMSFYYSRPQMAATGTLMVDGAPHDVTGTMWFDRQWGASINNPWEKWDWYSLRLDDGSKVMLYVFRDTTGPVALGTYMPAVGELVPLAREDFAITPTAQWTSPHTGATYPIAWQIDVLPRALSVTVTPVAEDQELDVRASTFNIYWEGLCTVVGTKDGEEVAGYAYVELTNYPRR